MASEDYLPLFWKARREHLGNIQRVSEEIKELYREAAADLAARAAASREGSLSERWASEYARSLEQRVKELEAGLYDVTLQGLKRSAELPASAMGQWWEMVGGQSFRDAFAATPDSVLAGLLDGSFYRDRKGLSERIWRVAQGFEKEIGYIVQRGIAEKKSVAELAADLEQYVKPPAKRDFDWGKVYPSLSGKKVDFNAQRLARTSINHAYFLDNVKVCTENPFVEAMHWDLSNAHEERQVIPFGPDECDEYAEHDEGLGLGNFKPEEIPVPHPQCLCVQWAVIPDSLEDIGARIGAWASGEPDELLDEWYDKYGSRNPNGDAKEILREGLKYQGDGGIIKTERNMAQGYRKSCFIPLSNEDKLHLMNEIKAIGAEPKVFIFRDNHGSSYDDTFDVVFLSSNIFPSTDDSEHPRDRMSERAAIAHEYYGHRANRGTAVNKGAWNDEFRASYMAAKNCPNLSDEDRRYLVMDALERAKEAGVSIHYNDFIRGVLYG